MGWGALIGAGISAAGSALGSSGLFGGKSGPNTGEESSRINKAANQYLTPYTDPNFWSLNLPTMANQSIQYGLANAPMINQANMGQLQALLNQAFPGYQSMFGQAATNTQQLMQGNLPSDVLGVTQRAAAQMGLAGGYGPAMTGSNALRNVALTSLQTTQQGQQQFGNLMQMASNYMMPQPVNPLSLLPLSSILGATEWGKSSAFSAAQAMFNAKAMAAAAGAGFPPSSGAMQGIGGIANSVASLFQPNPGTGQSPIGSLFRMFGGSGGGGDGGGIIDMSGLGMGTTFGY